MEELDDPYLATEVDRAIRETRAALGALALTRSLTGALMSLCTLIDRITVDVTSEPGDSAFELREESEAVLFRTSTLRQIAIEMRQLAVEIGFDDPDEARRVAQLGINLFVIHELVHIRQNFPDFATVEKIKAGFAGFGLPVLDLAADVLSAWVCAHVEQERTQDTGPDAVLPHYVNALVFAYVIGSFVFDSRSSPGKRQRVLGLIVSAMLVQAKIDGLLVESKIYEGWQPISPVMLLNADKSGTFNALVIDSVPGLLLQDVGMPDEFAAREFWESVGRRPIQRTLALAVELLAQMNAIRRD